MRRAVPVASPGGRTRAEPGQGGHDLLDPLQGPDVAGASSRFPSSPASPLPRASRPVSTARSTRRRASATHTTSHSASRCRRRRRATRLPCVLGDAAESSFHRGDGNSCHLPRAMSVAFIAPWQQRWGCGSVGGRVPEDRRVNLRSGVMGNDERSGGRDDWRVRLATAVGVLTGVTVALLLRQDLGSFWLGLLAFMAVVAAGGVLGRLVGSFLFRQPSGSSPRT
jgi:hypothetical protein